MALWSKVISFFAGEAAGIASAEVVKPAFETTRQNAWAQRPYLVLDPDTAADAEAKNFAGKQTFTSLKDDGTPLQSSEWDGSQVDFADDARRNGVGPARWDVLRRRARMMPPYPEALKLWRRERIDEATVDAVLDWEAVPAGLRPALKELLGERLDPEVMANAVQQSFVPNAGLLSDPVDGPPFDVPLESVPLDTLKEFKAAGIDKNRAQVLAYLSGNPPAPEQLAAMVLRSQISADTFIHGLREGRTKTKWAKALLHFLTHPLLTPGTMVQRRLRGYDDAAEFHRRMALYGYSAQQADDWFEASGRPLAPQQMLDLIARKGPSPTGSGPFTFADFQQGMVESDIKPKYSTPAEALYYKYPPLFQLRRAVESGGMTKERAEAIMNIERYEPQDIKSLLDSWVVTSATADPHIGRAETQLWTTLHASYKGFESTDSTVEEGLTLIGVPQSSHARILELWRAERDLVRKQLTPAQIKKAFGKAEKNPATGQPWTRDEAITALVSRGYNVNDANSLLDL